MIAPHLPPHARAHPRSRAPHALLRYTAAGGVLLLLGAMALVARPHGPALRTIEVGRWPNALLLDGARAFVADDGAETLSILDLAHTHLLRTVIIGHNPTFVPLVLALVPHMHRLFVADQGDDGSPSLVWVLDSRTGARLSTVRVGPTASALAVDERRGHVFVATEGDGRVRMLDARTGTPLHTSLVGADISPVALAVDARRAHALVLGWPRAVSSPETLAMATGVVSLLDTRSGAVLRTVAVGLTPTALALDPATGRAFVDNADDGTVSVLDTGSGRVLRTVRVGATPCAMAVNQRRARVFVLNAGDGTLSVLDAHTGLVLHTLVFDRAAPSDLTAALPYALAVDERRDRLYVSTPGPPDRSGVPQGQGRLYVFDARSGVRLRTISSGVNPHAIAVAEGSGRVVVTDGGGMVRPEATWLDQGLHVIRGWLPWLGGIMPRSPATQRVPGSVSVITFDA